jgi:TonB family protein
MSKLLTYFFFFQCLNLGFSQQAMPSGNTVPEPIMMDFYEAFTPFIGDYAVVYNRQNRKCCLIDKQGKEVSQYYEYLEHPKNGLIKTAETYAANTTSIMDLSGKVIVHLDKFKCDIYDDYIVASDAKNSSYKLFDLTGRLILTLDKSILPVRKNCFLTQKDSTYQIINEQGKVLAKTVAKELKKLNSRYFAFQKGKVWGIMNDKFKVVISPKYEGITPLPNAWIGLYNDGKYSVLDANLREAIPFGAYEEIGFIDYSRGTPLVGDGMIPVKKNQYWGYANIKNQLVIDFWFSKPTPFLNGYALQDRGRLLIDKEGRIIQNFPFSETQQIHLYSNLILAKIDYTFCYVDLAGNIILKAKPQKPKADEWPAPPVEQTPPPPVEPKENIVVWPTNAVPEPPPPVEPMEGSVAPQHNEVATVEEIAEYVGGKDALAKFLKDNLVYPERAKKAKIEGRVYVRFTLKSDGTLENPLILRGLGYGCDEEAIRLVKAMPNWKPAKQQGKAVRTQLTIPINFKL